MKKNEAKLKHLRRKYRKNEEEKVDKVPEVIEDLNLENLSVFNRKKYDEKPVIEYDTEVIGEVTLTENERLVLRLPPKFSVEENLPPEGLALEGEMSFTKARMTLRQEEEARMEEEDDEGIGDERCTEGNQEEEMEKMEKLAAQTRQIYDPRTRTFDDRKRRATDLKECARVTFPRPLETKHEAMFEMRREINGRT